MNQLRALRAAIVEPIKHRSPALLFQRCEQLAHQHSGGRVHYPLRKVIKRLRPKVDFPPLLADVVPRLQSQGYAELRRLSPFLIERLYAFALTTPAYATDDPTRKPTDLQFGEAHTDFYRYSWWVRDMLEVPAVRTILATPIYYIVAQDYLGCRPTMTSFKLWYDPPSMIDSGTHHWHYDNDGPHFLKFFIYLNDVGMETGYHGFIAGTHDPRKPRKLRRNRYFDFNEIMEAYNGKAREVIFSPLFAGTTVAEDTMGFHRAFPPRKGYRFLLQMQFADIDIPEQELYEDWSPVTIPGLDPSIGRIAWKFVR